MRKVLEIGGIVAAAVLVAFGIGAIVMGVSGRGTVRDSLKLEQIVGSPDMTPAAIAAEAKTAGLPASVSLPTVSVAGQSITPSVVVRVLDASGNVVDTNNSFVSLAPSRATCGSTRSRPPAA